MSLCSMAVPFKQNGPHQKARAEIVRLQRSLLLVATLEGCAQDVAERSARIGRTEIGNGFTLFGDFERLDRELDAAGLAVVLGDACVDLFALAETLGTLVVAIAGEVGATDEGRDFAVRDANFDAAFVNVDDFGGDNSVLAQATGFAASSCTRLGQIISSELLDAEADAFLFD